MGTKIQGFKFALIYAEKLAVTQAFYEKHLGFQKTAEFRPGEIYGTAGEIEIWIQEGHIKHGIKCTENEGPTRVSVMFQVESVGALFNSLKESGETVLLDEPQEMMPGTFFLKFLDPSGNVVDVLGAK